MFDLLRLKMIFGGCGVKVSVVVWMKTMSSGITLYWRQDGQRCTIKRCLGFKIWVGTIRGSFLNKFRHASIPLISESANSCCSWPQVVVVVQVYVSAGQRTLFDLFLHGFVGLFARLFVDLFSQRVYSFFCHPFKFCNLKLVRAFQQLETFQGESMKQ